MNTETIKLADNVIVLNSNFTSGTPSEDAGIIISRGGSADTGLFWDESDAAELGGRWTVGFTTTTELDTISGFVNTVQTSTSVPGGSNYGTGYGSLWIDSNDGTGQVYIRMT